MEQRFRNFYVVLAALCAILATLFASYQLLYKIGYAGHTIDTHDDLSHNFLHTQQDCGLNGVEAEDCDKALLNAFTSAEATDCASAQGEQQEPTPHDDEYDDDPYALNAEHNSTHQSKPQIVKRISIVMPARNEEERIPKTLKTYIHYFDQLAQEGLIDYEIIVVNNGSTDDTAGVVREIAQGAVPGKVRLIESEPGKGIAITTGFKDALTRPNDLIGFVDADMATAPQYYYELVEKIDDYDGIIASRNMPGAVVTPPRPFVRKWGRKIFFDSLVRLFFGISYYDTQCGAKLFTRKAIETIVPHITVTQWAYDIDLLYLCKKYGLSVREIPTVWNDQAGSKLNLMKGGMRMLSAIFKLRFHHSPFGNGKNEKKRKKKKSNEEHEKIVVPETMLYAADGVVEGKE